eukprot:g27202.t1
MRVLCLVLPLVAGHEGSMEEVLAVMRQMESIPERERRCLLCHTIAKGWARALESKVASLPTRQLHEEEFIDVEHQWLCQHILESVGEDDLWRIFVRFKDIPAEHLCTAEVRMWTILSTAGGNFNSLGYSDATDERGREIPFCLDDHGLFYCNAIEAAASAMEMAVIGAKNCVLLAKNRLKGLTEKIDKTRSKL